MTEIVWVNATQHVSSLGYSIASQTVLAAGRTYRLTVDGNYTAWYETAYPYGVGRTVRIKYDSPDRTNGSIWAEMDAEVWYAAPDNSSVGPTYHGHGLDWSLDGGATWGRSAEPLNWTPGSRFRDDATYVYEVIGKGYPIRLGVGDANRSDNNGMFKVTIGGRGWVVGAIACG